MEIENLKETYEKYKNRSYNFGRYSTDQDISKAFSEGKIFVMKGGFDTTDYFLLILCWIIALIMLCVFLIYPLENLGILSFFGMVLFVILGSATFIKYLRFLIVGPQGVFFRTFNKKEKFFKWDELINIQDNGRRYRSMEPSTVICYLLERTKYKFTARNYVNKEFTRKNYKYLFVRLFVIYKGLAKN